MYRGMGFRSRRSSYIGVNERSEAEKSQREVTKEQESEGERSSTHLSIRDRSREQLSEVLVTLLILVPSLPPLSDGFSVEDEDVEEGIEEEDDVGFDGDRVEEDGLGRDVEGVGHESGLDHDEGVVDVFGVEDVTARKEQERRGKENASKERESAFDSSRVEEERRDERREKRRTHR